MAVLVQHHVKANWSGRYLLLSSSVVNYSGVWYRLIVDVTSPSTIWHDCRSLLPSGCATPFPSIHLPCLSSWTLRLAGLGALAWRFADALLTILGLFWPFLGWSHPRKICCPSMSSAVNLKLDITIACCPLGGHAQCTTNDLMWQGNTMQIFNQYHFIITYLMSLSLHIYKYISTTKMPHLVSAGHSLIGLETLPPAKIFWNLSLPWRQFLKAVLSRRLKSWLFYFSFLTSQKGCGKILNLL